MSNAYPRLPFNLKVKPARHYFNGGSIYFKSEDGKLWYSVTHTTKDSKSIVRGGWVGSEKHLKQLMSVKSINEIPGLTEVVI